jgi:hypothetical protein
MENHGKVSIGRRIGNNDPELTGYTTIVVLTPSTKWGMLGPYCLKNNEGHLMENIWQFAKVFGTELKSNKEYHWAHRCKKYAGVVIWEYDGGIHINDDGELTDEYWLWRKKGMECQYPIRYPNGYKNKRNTLFTVKNKDNLKHLNYIDARKKIYLPVYCDLVKKHPKFAELKSMLKTNNLLIIDIDGPHYESIKYYKEKYNVSDDFITENHTINCDTNNMKILLNDSKHSFGHGYCLALALLDKENEINCNNTQ